MPSTEKYRTYGHTFRVDCPVGPVTDGIVRFIHDQQAKAMAAFEDELFTDGLGNPTPLPSPPTRSQRLRRKLASHLHAWALRLDPDLIDY